MKTIPNKLEKFIYLCNKFGMRCPIAEINGRWERCTELHHRLSDTNTNCKLYPNFIQSILNLRPVNNIWHIKNPGYDKLKSSYRTEQIEKFLSNPIHKRICEWVNNPVGNLWRES